MVRCGFGLPLEESGEIKMKRLYDAFLPVLQLLTGMLGLLTLLVSDLRGASLTSIVMTVALTVLGLILGTHGIAAYSAEKNKMGKRRKKD